MAGAKSASSSALTSAAVLGFVRPTKWCSRSLGDGRAVRTQRSPNVRRLQPLHLADGATEAFPGSVRGVRVGIVGELQSEQCLDLFGEKE